ncbi:acyl-CoA carboxylase subunit epsilon [Glutamicibacter creatinolyticus]|uniref:acyl-CoA carboxylase subunit epsilon n=1 Tax=Glutamicibacter creatinolyticus TaxID=162496 RepID=UPI0033DB2356
MEQHTATRQATAALTVTRGNPSPEELAAVTALLSAMGSQPNQNGAAQAPAGRVTRIRKRRALSTPRLPWSIGRR